MTRLEKFGWAVGAHGSQVMIGIYSFYLLFYLTGVLGIDALRAGQIIFVVRLYDLVTDPLMGYISDRTVSKRGRRRPWLLLGALACTGSFILLFNLPSYDNQSTTVVAVTLVLLLYATAYTVFNVPHLAMPAEMTDEYHERTVLMSYRVIFFATANLAAILGGSLLLKKFGDAQGYPLLGWSVGTSILVSMLICYRLTASVKFIERTEQSPYSLVEQWIIVARNKPFIVFILAKLGMLTAQASQVSAFLFFSQYVLERGTALLTSLGIFLTIGPVVAAPAWNWASRRWGKRNAFMLAAFLYAVVVASWLLAGPQEPSWLTNLRVLCLGLVVGGVIILGFSLLPDTIEYDRRRTGLNREGLYSGVYSTMEKAASAFGPLLFSMYLAANGFVSSKAGETVVQPDATVTVIYLAVGLFPALAALFAIAVLTQYDLDENTLAASQRLTN